MTHASDGIGQPLSFAEGKPSISETVGSMKSPRERLLAAHAELRGAARQLITRSTRISPRSRRTPTSR